MALVKPVTFPSVVHPRCLDLQLAGRRGHLPRLGHAVAHHQRVSVLVALVGMLGEVVIDLGFERRQQHPTGALAHQCVEVELQGILLGLVRSDYAQHAAYLSLAALQPPLVFDNQEGTPRSSPPPRSTTSGYTSLADNPAPAHQPVPGGPRRVACLSALNPTSTLHPGT